MDTGVTEQEKVLKPADEKEKCNIEIQMKQLHFVCMCAYVFVHSSFLWMHMTVCVCVLVYVCICVASVCRCLLVVRKSVCMSVFGSVGNCFAVSDCVNACNSVLQSCILGILKGCKFAQRFRRDGQ